MRKEQTSHKNEHNTLMCFPLEPVFIRDGEGVPNFTDEPTSGLDPATRNEFLEILQEFIQDGEKSVLFSTHITTDLERITDYITYLENGRVIYTGDMDGLMQKYYLIKGEPAKLTNELKKDILGIRSTTIGFEGLVETKLAHKYKGYILDVPTIDDIIICMSKEGKK